VIVELGRNLLYGAGASTRWQLDLRPALALEATASTALSASSRWWSWA